MKGKKVTLQQFYEEFLVFVRSNDDKHAETRKLVEKNSNKIDENRSLGDKRHKETQEKIDVNTSLIKETQNKLDLYFDTLDQDVMKNRRDIDANREKISQFHSN